MWYILVGPGASSLSLTSSNGFNRSFLSTSHVVLCFGYFLLGILFGCGSGGSSGTASPSTPAFYSIDVPTAGTLKRQGTFPVGVNANGQIAGYAQDSAYVYIGFVKSSGGDLTTFQYSPGQFTSVQGTVCDGINSSGTALCRFESSGTAIFTRSWAGVPTPVILPSGDTSWNPAAINDQGDVAGQFEDSNFQFHAYLRVNDGTFTAFDPPTGGVSGISRINDADETIGEFIDGQNRLHGFLRTVDGVFTQIDAPGPSGEATYLTNLYGINSSGAMVGSVRAASGDYGFLRTTDGTVTLIDPPGVGGPGSYASDITVPASSQDTSTTQTSSLTVTSVIWMAHSQ
jgi:hypothetical protein